jgi:hypothetical protein
MRWLLGTPRSVRYVWMERRILQVADRQQTFSSNNYVLPVHQNPSPCKDRRSVCTTYSLCMSQYHRMLLEKRVHGLALVGRRPYIYSKGLIYIQSPLNMAGTIIRNEHVWYGRNPFVLDPIFSNDRFSTISTLFLETAS